MVSHQAEGDASEFSGQDVEGVSEEAEIAEYVAGLANVVDIDGHRMVVRNGYLPKRDLKWRVFEAKLGAARRLVKFRFDKELKPHPTPGDPAVHPSGSPESVTALSEAAIQLAQEAGVFGLPDRR